MDCEVRPFIMQEVRLGSDSKIHIFTFVVGRKNILGENFGDRMRIGILG